MLIRAISDGRISGTGHFPLSAKFFGGVVISTDGTNAADVVIDAVGSVAAFETAGAKSVLATLWSIDESSAEMMGTFYGAMAKGNSTPAALRQAKLQLLQRRVKMGGVEVSLAHPFFWAPFILVGAPPSR